MIAKTSKLDLASVIPISISVAGFVMTLFSITTFIRMVPGFADQHGPLYVIIATLVLGTLVPAIILNARKWTDIQLSCMIACIFLPAVAVAYVYLIDMPEINVRFTTTSFNGWNPAGTTNGLVFSVVFLALQCLVICLHLTIAGTCITTRAAILGNEPSVIDQIAWIRSPSMPPAARPDLLLAGVFIVACSALGIFQSGSNEKYYLLVSIIFQLLAVISIGLTRKMLHPANVEEGSKARLDALESRPPLHPGVPGRIGMVTGYLLLFLLGCTLLIQKNDAGNDVDVMVQSLSFALPGIGAMMILAWVSGILRINAHFWRFVTLIILGGILATYLYGKPSRNFAFMTLPISWFIAGIIIGMCFTGLWDLLWPLARWKSRTTTRVLAVFLIAFVAFANGLVQININARDTQIYAYIMYGVLALCMICGIISLLCILVAKRGAKRGTQVIKPSESSNAE